jgi:YVTN family beta-propeller protein
MGFASLGEVALHEDSPLPSGPRPFAAVLSPDGTRLYVSCGRGGSVAVVDVASRKQVRSLEGVGERVSGIAISEDGRHVYTANGTFGDTSIIDVVTGNVDKRLHVGGLPWGIVRVP